MAQLRPIAAQFVEVFHAEFGNRALSVAADQLKQSTGDVQASWSSIVKALTDQDQKADVSIKSEASSAPTP